MKVAKKKPKEEKAAKPDKEEAKPMKKKEEKPKEAKKEEKPKEAKKEEKAEERTARRTPRPARGQRREDADMAAEPTIDWVPTTELGKDVMSGKITSMDEIFKRGLKIQEPNIVDKLLPNLEDELILVGGSPGKGGGIRRTPTKRTARMHKSGRRFRVSAVVIVGNRDGYVGIGKASAIEHVPAIAKAKAEAKLNIIPIRRGCGSWECTCGENHSIPFEVRGKCGSVEVILKPAPKGVGLCVNNEMKKIISLAGIKDIWSKSFGNTKSRVNTAFALFDAFKKLNMMKVADVSVAKAKSSLKSNKKKGIEAE